MTLHSKNILITGAGGFVGSHLVESLIVKGCNVKCFTRYNSRNEHGLLKEISSQKIKEIEVISGDLRDSYTVSQAVKGVDIVFHLGALIAIPYSYKNPADVVSTNVMGTMNILNAARNYETSKIIHTSTSEVYGSAKYVPIDEKHPLQGQSPYSASKIGADKLVESFYNSYSLPVATIRPFNIYGPRQSARAVIPTIIMQALSRDKICLGSLHPTRDYTYVSDTVEAFIQIAENDSSIGKTLNIGSNKEISIGNLAKKICDLMNKKLEIVQEEKRKRPEKSEVDRLWADTSLAMETIHWKPQVSIEEGLLSTIEWMKENIQKYQTKEYVI